MEQNIELFEFAKQIATPEYVAVKVQDAQNSIGGAELAIVVSLCALGVALILALIGFVLSRKTKVDPNTVYSFAVGIAVIFGFVLVAALMTHASSTWKLAAWQNDPVTRVADMLMEAID